MSQRAKKPRNLAEAILLGLKAKGWSQGKLARMLDTDSNVVANWIHGRNRPSFESYVAMAVLFGWPLPFDPGDSATRAWLKLVA